MITCLILDDSHARHEHFKAALDGALVSPVYTAAQAIDTLARFTYDAVFLDHDLEMSGPGHGSGTDVVEAIIAMCRAGTYPSIDAVHCLHTANPERAEWMFGALRRDAGQYKAGIFKVCRVEEAWLQRASLGHFANSGEWTTRQRWTDPLIFD